MLLVSEVGKFSGFAFSVISRLVVEIFMQKNDVITNFHLALGVPLIMPMSILVAFFNVKTFFVVRNHCKSIKHMLASLYRLK